MSLRQQKISRSDPRPAVIASQTHSYREALASAIDAQDALTQIVNADRAQGALLASSSVLSLGTIALGGSAIIGFAGWGTSASVVGAGTFTVSASLGGAGRVVLTGTGSTVGSTAVTSTVVTGSLTVIRLAERFLDPRLNSDSQAATQQLNSAVAAQHSAFATLRAAYRALAGCK